MLRRETVVEREEAKPSPDDEIRSQAQCGLRRTENPPATVKIEDCSRARVALRFDT
jgi:hypothetical protein